jgi:hypothetical protein
MASQVIPYKRTSTFSASCTYTPESGGPTNLDGITITSDIRDANGRVYSCTVVKTSSTTFTVSLSDTSGWSLGSAYWDIRFTQNGVIFFSDTVILSVSNNITIE